MAEIKIIAESFEPNIILLKNYIITFNNNLIILYNLNSLILDKIEINQKISYLNKIDNNYFIAISINNLFKINIIYDRLLVYNIIKLEEIFTSCLALKNNIFILSSLNNIKIFDFNSSYKEPIQIINNCKYPKLFYWNDDIFITYNSSSFISLYKRICGTKSFQLMSTIRIISKLYFSFSYLLKLLKLDNKTFMMLNNKNIYLIDMKKMKINHNIYFFNRFNDIKFAYKIKNNIYIFCQYKLFMFQYFKNSMILIKIIEENELVIFNYLLNLSVKAYYPNLNKNLIINCVENIDSFQIMINFFKFYYYSSDENNTSINKILGETRGDFIKKKEKEFAILSRDATRKFERYEKRFSKLFQKYKCKKKEIKETQKHYKKNYR